MVIYIIFSFLTVLLWIILKPIAAATPMYYGSVLFLISILVTGFTLIDSVMKLMGYGVQGEKLKIREEDGFQMEELRRRLNK